MDTTRRKYFEEELLAEACARYQLDGQQTKLIRSNINLIYDAGDRVLRVSHTDDRNAKEIEAELDWLHFLGQEGLPVVKVLSSQNQLLLEQIGSEEEHYSLVVFEKIEGERIPEDQWGPVHFERLGALCGLLHRVGGQYQHPSSMIVKDWDEIPEFFAYTHLPDDERALAKLYHELVNQFRTIPKRSDNYGLIHYDIHHGNYLFTADKQLILLDFEMTCRSWYINDVATILYYAHRYPKAQRTDQFKDLFLDYFWRGYEREYQIAQEEKKWIPYFLLYRDLMLYGILTKIWPLEERDEQKSRFISMLETSIEDRRMDLGL